MKLLLDTHAFLWAITDDPRMSEVARKNFEASENELFLSVASVWEVIAKVQLGRMKFPAPTGTYLKSEMAKNNVQVAAAVDEPYPAVGTTSAPSSRSV